MGWQKILPAAVVVCILLAGCDTSPEKKQGSSEFVGTVVTADIQAGIEKHIDEQTKSGGGHFRFDFEGSELKLKLVKVHTEYLANLGSGRYFACIDLASVEGNVYDVDFFLAGEPNAMAVTETTIHKVNGQPLYVWKQKRNKSWRRFPYKDAPPELLGVIKGSDKFEFLYQATLPEMDEKAKMWIPLPRSDKFQTIKINSMQVPGEYEILEDSEHDNSVLFTMLKPEDSGKTVLLSFDVERIEKGIYGEENSSPERYLGAESLVPADERFRKIAEEVVAGKDDGLVRARAIYDHTIERMRYAKYGEGWGKGDAVFACDSRHGNCTDFHSYFIALCRAVGIPARFAIGAAVPSERDQGGVDGYHCWAEFFADSKWWPVDISEGDKCSSLTTYYFGHHPANRVEFSRGRDIIVEPGPVSGPINFLAYPVLEVGGQLVKTKIFFSFNRDTFGKQ